MINSIYFVFLCKLYKLVHVVYLMIVIKAGHLFSWYISSVDNLWRSRYTNTNGASGKWRANKRAFADWMFFFYSQLFTNGLTQCFPTGKQTDVTACAGIRVYTEPIKLIKQQWNTVARVINRFNVVKHGDAAVKLFLNSDRVFYRLLLQLLLFKLGKC